MLGFLSCYYCIKSLDGGSRSWNIQFHHDPDDWEVERVYAFYKHIYSKIPRGEGVDRLFWKLTANGVFDVRFFYNSLSNPPTISFSWKCIWSVKVLRRVSFYGEQLGIVFSLLITL